MPMLGYMHWSITDNYEWGTYTHAFRPIPTIDYAAERRTCRGTDHLGDTPSETYARLIKG